MNRPDKAAEIVRRVLKERYNTTATGLPGNDDSGSMSAWYIFHSMGFYPNAGQDIYLISSPVFTKTTINLDGGKVFEVLAPNASDKNIYIAVLVEPVLDMRKICIQPLQESLFTATSRNQPVHIVRHVK